MLDSLLIANRGEIASRIIRTARRMGVRTIAVYSTADADAPFVKQADAAVAIGAAPALESYLCADALLAAALDSSAAAVHPGYGFLSENAGFADAVLAAGLIWVGAPPAAIRAMGFKDAAKNSMQRAGVPVTPGYWGTDQEPRRLREAALALGYPLLIKAVAGGGGRGMRRVDTPADFDAALDACRREAAAAFADDRVLLETYITRPRHIEVQVFGDAHGQLVHLFERDCSVQRRHQKVIEEAPAPGLTAATRETLYAMALKAARAVDYVGAGTVEFIADASRGIDAARIWFMEMNTRLQVEHGVTEAVTGQDLVEWQLRVASGEALPCTQAQLRMEGWAMEARLYAEDPAAGFLPSAGRLQHLRLPTTLRVDCGVAQEGEVTPFYDPLLAKLIAHAPNRAAAARRLAAACGAVQVWPVRTNAAWLARLVAHEAFVAGDVDTGFIERYAAELLTDGEPDAEALHAAALALWRGAGDDPWTALSGFRANAPTCFWVDLWVGRRRYAVDLNAPVRTAGPAASPTVVRVDGQRLMFSHGGAWAFGSAGSGGAAAAASTDGSLTSPMPGRIVSVGVQPGERVVQGQRLLALEAMKMEHALLAPFAGRVAALAVSVGDQVAENVTLVRIVADAEPE